MHWNYVRDNRNGWLDMVWLKNENENGNCAHENGRQSQTKARQRHWRVGGGGLPRVTPSMGWHPNKSLNILCGWIYKNTGPNNDLDRRRGWEVTKKVSTFEDDDWKKSSLFGVKRCHRQFPHRLTPTLVTDATAKAHYCRPLHCAVLCGHENVTNCVVQCIIHPSYCVFKDTAVYNAICACPVWLTLLSFEVRIEMRK